MKRSGTPTYLRSRKIKDLKDELVEEEKRLESLRKNTAAAATNESRSRLADNRSDSSSVIEDVDKTDSLSYHSTSNRLLEAVKSMYLVLFCD